MFGAHRPDEYYLQITRMQRSDFDDVLRVDGDAIPGDPVSFVTLSRPMSEKQLRGSINKDIGIVAKLYQSKSGLLGVGKFVGFVGFGIYAKFPNGVKLKRLVVSPNYQGHGYGREILSHVKQSAREREFVFSVVPETHLESACVFLSRNGFLSVDVAPGYCISVGHDETEDEARNIDGIMMKFRVNHSSPVLA